MQFPRTSDPLAAGCSGALSRRRCCADHDSGSTAVPLLTFTSLLLQTFCALRLQVLGRVSIMQLPPPRMWEPALLADCPPDTTEARLVDEQSRGGASVVTLIKTMDGKGSQVL